jgi:hypothetical protein
VLGSNPYAECIVNYIKLGQQKSYTGQTEVAQCALARSRIKEKVGWFDVPMDDFSRMDVTKGAKHAAKIGFDASHRQSTIEILQCVQAKERITGQSYSPENRHFDGRA